MAIPMNEDGTAGRVHRQRAGVRRVPAGPTPEAARGRLDSLGADRSAYRERRLTGEVGSQGESKGEHRTVVAGFPP
jgi:hypothetical protein